MFTEGGEACSRSRSLGAVSEPIGQATGMNFASTIRRAPPPAWARPEFPGTARPRPHTRRCPGALS
jgi:hypothetical protein